MERAIGYAPCRAIRLTVLNSTPRVTFSTLWMMVLTTVGLLFGHGHTVYAQCPVICHASLTVALDSNGMYVLEPADLLQNVPAGCVGDFEVSVTDTLGNTYADTLNGDFIGQVLTASVLHADSGNSCETDLTVVDNLPPHIACDTLFIYCNMPTAPAAIGFPEITDNVSPLDSITYSFSDTFTDLDCFAEAADTLVTARIDRTWIAQDESGNVDTCVQNIWLLRATLDMVEFPPHFNGFDQAPLECAVDDPYDLNLTGQPTINNYPLTNASDCELTTSFLDNEVPVCGGQVKIVRTWIVYDLCTDESRVFAQIILVEDNTPPEIECPEGVTFNTYTNSCMAQVWLPAATASDLCSDFEVQPSWQFGVGQGPYNNVPTGVYEVTYKAVDACGNESACKIHVTVEDDDVPTAICDNQIEIALQSDGTALIFAETFDNGSHDNCAIDHFEVSRDNSLFDEFVYFDCADIGTPAAVYMKVFDANGLVSDCVSHVSVTDPVKPEIVCPPANNLNCGMDYTNTALTGMPFATDNCAIGNIDFSDNVNLNSCGIGTVLRTWTATDESGNATSCTQTIEIKDNTPLSITFPDDVVTYNCGADTDPSVMGAPVVTGTDCENLGIDHTDFEFYTAYPACYQLVRKWAIIEFCSFDPATGAGFWEHTQIIEVHDDEAPIVTCPDDLTVGIDNASDCETFAQLPSPMVDDCSEELVITNNSTYAFDHGADPSGVYPKGEHTITFLVSDGCGNASQCSMKLLVVDAEPPNPVCNNGVTVTIQQNGFVTVTPTMLDNGSWDNCSPKDQLVMQVSPNTFTCQNLGNQTVTLTVTDPFGNSAFCKTTVVVQDNFDVCPDIGNVTIAGKISAPNGEAVAQKLVGLSGGVSMAMHTNVDGTFAFQGLPTNQDYTLTPTYDKNPLNGVTTYDLVLIRKHILGIDPFTSPYQWIAADVNKSGTVTTIDLVELRKMILSMQVGFKNNTSWRFVDAKYVFQNPNKPLDEDFPEKIELHNLGANAWDQNFVAVKVGDVNGSADAANFTDEAGNRNLTEPLTFRLPNIHLTKGYEYEIPFRATGFRDLLGFQFALTLATEKVELVGVECGDVLHLTPENFGTARLDQGLLTASWEAIPEQNLPDRAPAFTLKLRALKDARLSEVLSLSEAAMPAEAYTGSMHAPAADLDFKAVNVEFEREETPALQLLPNYPNPFDQRTTVGFYLPKPTEVLLAIYDLYGHKVWQKQGAFSQGFHETEINLDQQYIKPGILILELNADGFKPQTRKMTFMK